MPDLDHTAPRYELKDLTARAGVTARTVHFYIQQGLLPPAGAPGPGARYSEAFLARLILIRRLQREHLPLAEIRQRLAGLDDRSVMQLIAVSEQKAATTPPDTSALDYVRAVLAEAHPRPRPASPAQPPVSPQAAASSPVPAPPAASRTSWLRELTSPFRGAAEATQAELRAPAAPAASLSCAPSVGSRSQWDRIVLAPDVELHVCRPLTRDLNKRVERLLAAAREILQEEQ